MIRHLFKDFDFSVLGSRDFKEDSVREELIQPILKALGYSVSGKNKIIRSKALVHPFSMIGSQERKIYIIPDYLMQVRDKYAWVLDAKAPYENIRRGKNVEQAYSYAIHPHIRVKFYALCNGREFTLFHIESTDPILHLRLSEIAHSWEKLYGLLSPQAFKNTKAQPVALSDMPFSLVSPSQEPSILIIGHRLDGEVQCVLWDEDEPNIADYDIVIADLTIDRKPLLPLHRPRLWRDPQFDRSSYLNWTHTRSRIESLALSGSTIFFIVNSSFIKHVDSPASYGEEHSRLLPFILYGERTPIGTSISLVDSRFGFYFRNLGSWNFVFGGQVQFDFENTSNYKVGVHPIAKNRAGEMLGISIAVSGDRCDKPGWIHILPLLSTTGSFEATKLLVENLNNFV